jgi:hypothetical protein
LLTAFLQSKPVTTADAEGTINNLRACCSCRKGSGNTATYLRYKYSVKFIRRRKTLHADLQAPIEALPPLYLEL